MKRATVLLTLLLICAAPRTLSAQTPGEWVAVTSADGQFTVRMPSRPEVASEKKRYGGLQVEGERYRVVDNGAVYTFWALTNRNYRPEQSTDKEGYLDECADLVWESLLAPERESVPKGEAQAVHMSYIGPSRTATLAGREYSISMGRSSSGVTNFYVARERIFALTVLNAAPDEALALRFLRSFARAGEESKSDGGDRAGAMMGEGFGPGRGTSNNGTGATGAPPSGPVDYNRVFNARDVMQKARIISRPEPSYTESARKYSVTGTVILRAVFSKTGEVTNIRVVKGLPHGVTAEAVTAARGIKFIPAQINGRDVSQYIQIEYNFNLY